MKEFKNLTKYSEISSKKQLSEINGGIHPILFINDLIIWTTILADKLETWLKSQL